MDTSDDQDLHIDAIDLFMERYMEEANTKQIDAGELPSPITRAEIIEEQKTDDFCQTVIAKGQCDNDDPSARFFEDEFGILRRRHPRNPAILPIVLPASLRPRALRIAHRSVLAGHPGQTRMNFRLRRVFYWPHMAADIQATVRECPECAKNRIRLLKHTNPLKLFPAERPLESVAVDILGPLPISKKKYRFILVITDRYTKLTQVVPLRRIKAYDVAVAFVEHWIFKYGPPATLLSDNGSQFVAMFFQRVCQLLGITNLFTTTYHPQTNGQTERFNRSLTAMLRCFVDDHPEDWCKYASALAYAYNQSVHRSTQTTPFELVLSRPPPEFTLEHNVRLKRISTAEHRMDYVDRLKASLTNATRSLRRTQARYKRDFDKRIRRRRAITVGDRVFLNLNDGVKKPSKLSHTVSGPFEVKEVFDNTISIQRGDIVERVSTDRVTPAPKGLPIRTSSTDATALDFARKQRSGQTWLFDKILNHRETGDNSVEFKIQWTGDYEPTWEPRDNVPEEAISRYFAKYKRKSQELRKRPGRAAKLRASRALRKRR